MPKGRARSLIPKFIGPYKILAADPATSSYKIELPDELENRRVHPRFHANLLRPHVPNDDARFPNRNIEYFYDLGNYIEGETLVEDLLDHMWTPRLMFQVKWADGDITWAPLSVCSKLVALDRYLALHNVSRPSDLPKAVRRR
ncbi:hypothetical protein EXIGLDRAFT_624945 [Exidia glandulosa HHB12029]|uniref:Tf2-1-like SH3-like domain-containing protein n=1 Tax=Exidia glandulosa HHB12029 TaxID=1314781 RepID=A0A165D893_EXIGL|nr:hypothetical protein EXIGLDRAFT_624945 [Exidia glandulosa HHB12029]